MSRPDGGGLRGRRRAAERAWESWVDRSAADPVTAPAQLEVRPEILDSWRRSTAAVTPAVTSAPMADETETSEYFAASPLRRAVHDLADDLRSVADDGDLVVAVTDPQTRILWTYGGRAMRRKAESVNFVAAGRWDESSVGTNALNLALRTDATTTVFSAEHYASIIHSWVCWAAPVHDPTTGAQLGVLDLSTTWDHAHPLGATTAQALARLLESRLDIATPGVVEGERAVGPGLHLRLLGRVEAWVDSGRVLLTRRQSEILALLCLHPDGLSLEQLHALLYGDRQVSLGTLKAEVSHLRSALGGRLASRPYRLEIPTTADVLTVREALRRGDVRSAVEAYGGDLVPGTDSPGLTEMADYLAVAVREALLADPDPATVLRYAEAAPFDIDVLDAALARVDAHGSTHPLRAELLGLRAARGRPRPTFDQPGWP